MGKEEELLKAVKAKDTKKVQKLLTTASVKKRGEEATWQSVDTGHKIRKRLTHIDVNTQDSETGSTPLLLAVLAGLRDLAEMLIFYSANVLAQDFKGNTGLHLAAFSGRVDLVSLLLANGADVDSMNGDQNTALHIACQTNAKPQLIANLIQAGANVWLSNKQEHTPLDTAAMYNKKEAVSLLLDHCPTLSSNQCAVVEAAMRDNVEVLELLLDYGVDPNQLDSLRGTTALHEAVRFCRAKSCKLLLAFGADPGKENLKRETPRSLIKELPAALQLQFDALFEESFGCVVRVPKYLAERENSLSGASHSDCLKDYPVLPSQQSWTENSPKYCSSCTEANSNLHVLDDNPQTFWVIPSLHDAWVSFNLGSRHVITAITIFGWDSPQMVHSFQLQSAESIQGPWSTFTAHICKRIGSSSPKDPAMKQTFGGFTVKLQFLRLYIVDNHGGSSICFQGIQLHGADCRVFDVLHSCDMMHHVDTFIQHGISTYTRLIDITEQDLTDIVEDPVEMSEIFQVVQALRRTVYPMRVLDWLVSPPLYSYAGQVLPDFSVQSDPGVNEEVEVIVQGAEVEGTRQVCLCPRGEGQASTAVFQGLLIKTVGRFTIRVQGVTTRLCLDAADQIDIRPAQRTVSEVSAAFDEIESMLNSIQDSL